MFPNVNKPFKIRNDNFDIENLDRNVPDINWSCDHYSDMIVWDSLSEGQICEPSVTKYMSNEQLIQSIKPRLKLHNFPNNTQAVEQGVRCVSEAVKLSYDNAYQKGSILQGVKSRSL